MGDDRPGCESASLHLGGGMREKGEKEEKKRSIIHYRALSAFPPLCTQTRMNRYYVGCLSVSMMLSEDV